MVKLTARTVRKLVLTKKGYMGEKGSMFPFQENGFLDFSSSFHPQHQTVLRPQAFDHTSLMAAEIPTNGRLDFAGNYKHVVGQKNPNFNGGDEKKLLRRDVERQRRKEMGGLYRNLIALIPYEYIKGKRSTSDRLQETVKYVKDLKVRVEGLKGKREELKDHLCSSSTNSMHNSNNNNAVKKCSIDKEENEEDDDDEGCRVTVKHCRGGIEVIVNIACSRRNEVPLSKLLRVIVMGGGISITTCVFTKVNKRLLHCIEAEVVEGRSIDVAQLEQKLMNLVYSH
nr:transcription factor bHLH120-like [Ipomoea trifida]